MDHGLDDSVIEKLIGADIGTVERLGSMTPEELEAIPDIGPTVVEKILIAVNAYYAQFEQPQETASAEPETLDALEAASEIATVESGHLVEASNSQGQVPLADPAVSSELQAEFDTIENSEEVR
jgi:N utilization substance protein A